MSKIPAALLKEILEDPFYLICARYGLHGHRCEGRVTFEHAIIYAGKQLQLKWAILPICAHGHAVDFYQDQGDLDKKVNLWIALNRATDAELHQYSKAIDYISLRRRLNADWGEYQAPVQHSRAIAY